MQYLPGADLPCGNLGNKPFKVAYPFNLLLNFGKLFPVLYKLRDHLMPVHYLFGIFKWQCQPALEQSASHGGNCLVYNIEQGNRILGI